MVRNVPTIIAIDDNNDNLVTIKAFVTDAFPGVRVFTALNGKKGIELAREYDPDVILLDIVMPGTDGFEICRQLKQDKKLRHIPVVFLTSLKGDRASRIRALEVGGEAFITKPFDEIELTAQIRAMIKIKAANYHLVQEKEQLGDLVVDRTIQLERELAERKKAEQELEQVNRALEQNKTAMLNLLEDLNEEIDVRKKSELALKESERKFRETVRTLDEGFYSCTLDGMLLEHNVAFNRILGIEADRDLKGTPLPVFWQNPQDRTPYVEELRVKGFVQNFTIQAQKTSGEKIVVLASAHLVRDEAGLVQRIEGTFTDFTQLKRAEEALRESEAHLLAVLDATPFPIALVDVSDNHIHFWSRSALTLFGHTAPTAAEWFEMAYPDPDYRRGVLERWKPALENARLSGRVVNAGEYRVTCRDGSVRTCELYAVFLADELIVTFNDITGRKRAEEARHESETRFTELFDTASSGIAIYEVLNDGLSGRDYIIRNFNRAALAIEGRKKEEVVGKSLFDLRPAIDDYGLIPIFKEVWKTGNPANYPATVYVDEKFANYYENRVFRLPGGEIVALYDDVTVQKRAEIALKESEEKYREFFTTSRDCVFMTSPEGHWIDFNDAAMEMFGYSSREEFARTSIVDRYSPPGQRAAFVTRIEREGYVKEEPIRLKRKDGRIIETLITAVPLRNPDGTLRAFIGTIRDVTEKKKAEDALRETNEYLRNLLDYTNAPIIVWDPQLRITRFNHAFERLTGRTEEEVLSKHLALLFPVLSRETSLAQIQKTLVGERWETVEIPILPVSGEVRIVLWSSANLVDPTGAVISTIAQGQDITDRKLTEVQRERLIAELEQKNAELERFTYTVSHDLKSPLITIKGFAGLLEADALKGDPVQLKKDIQRIMDAADTMQDLLVDLIELSRVGKIIKPPETIPFGTIAREAANLLAGPLAERNVTVAIAPDMPVVNVDHTRIREVMVNLIENAVKFLGERTDPEIRIGVDTTGETAVFFVADNGIGINPRYLERIFNLFERLDAAAPGTGIGLTIARRIIEVHGGKIWAESEGPGMGTTFRFTLPGPKEEGHQGILK